MTGILPPGTWLGYSTLNLIVAIAGIILGLIFLSCGYKLYLIAYFCVGFIFCGGLVYLLVYVHSNLGLAADLIIGISCGVVLGIVTLLIYPIALFFFGGFIGIFIATLVGLLVHIYIVDVILFVVLPLICGLAAFKFQKFFIILATSLGGSFGVLASIDYFAQNAGGFSDFFYYLAAGQTTISPTLATWLEVGAVIILTIIGVFIQYRYTGKKGKHRPLLKLRCFKKKLYHDSDDSGDEAEPIEKEPKPPKPKKDRFFMLKALRKKYEEI